VGKRQSHVVGLLAVVRAKREVALKIGLVLLSARALVAALAAGQINNSAFAHGLTLLEERGGL
jgi:hypothetical protein